MTAERPDSRQPGSVTQWIPGLRQGDQRAIQVLWEHYFEPLARLAEARLRGCPGGAGNGEDVAVEAFLSFCADARRDGHFPDLSRRTNVMRLLVRFTVCKAFDFRARQVRRHRVVLGESALGEAGFEPCAGASRRRSSRPRWPACWTSWTRTCGRSPSSAWKAGATRRSPPPSAAPLPRWIVACLSFVGSGKPTGTPCEARETREDRRDAAESP